MRNIILKLSAVVIFLFGFLTMFMSVSMIFDLSDARKSAGNYVFFLITANLILGMIYLCASYGFFKEKNWTTTVLFCAAFLLIFIFIILLIYILKGGIYQGKTIMTITIRTFITLIFTLISWNFITKKNQFSGYQV